MFPTAPSIAADVIVEATLWEALLDRPR